MEIFIFLGYRKGFSLAENNSQNEIKKGDVKEG